jgi:hypothetical protein
MRRTRATCVRAMGATRSAWCVQVLETGAAKGLRARARAGVTVRGVSRGSDGMPAAPGLYTVNRMRFRTRAGGARRWMR